MSDQTITNAHVRYWGAGQREQIAAIHMHHGKHVGYAAAERFINELATFAAEVHNPELVADVCFRAGDAVLSRLPKDAPPNIPGLEMSAPETEAEAGADPRAPLRERMNTWIAEITEWLQKRAPNMLRPHMPASVDERAIWHAAQLSCLRDLVSHLDSAR